MSFLRSIISGRPALKSVATKVYDINGNLSIETRNSDGRYSSQRTQRTDNPSDYIEFPSKIDQMQGQPESKSVSRSDIDWECVRARLSATTLKDSEKVDEVWQRLAVSQPFVDPPPSFMHVRHPSSTPKAPGHVRFVCISDTHNKMPAAGIPDGDVLIHAGDFTGRGMFDEVQLFVEAYLKQLPHAHKVVIAGNHDLSMDAAKYDHATKEDVRKVRQLVSSHCTYLEDSSVVIQGIHIYGSPWQPWFFDWAFNLERGEACLAKWRQIPDNADIVVTHGPPLGRGDLCESGNRAGCLDLLKELQLRVRPKVSICCFVALDIHFVKLCVHCTACRFTFLDTYTRVTVSHPILSQRTSTPPLAHSVIAR